MFLCLYGCLLMSVLLQVYACQVEESAEATATLSSPCNSTDGKETAVLVSCDGSSLILSDPPPTSSSNATSAAEEIQLKVEELNDSNHGGSVAESSSRQECGNVPPSSSIAVEQDPGNTPDDLLLDSHFSFTGTSHLWFTSYT